MGSVNDLEEMLEFFNANRDKYIIQSIKFPFPELGIVEVTVRSNSVRMVARRKGDTLRISIPPNTQFGRLLDFLTSLRTKLPRPDTLPRYSEGTVIDCGDVSFEIRRQRHKPLHVLTTPSLPRTYLEVGSEIDIESQKATRLITSVLCKAARALAAEVLLPRAAEIARELNLRPAQWTISTGHRTLGHCSGRGVIALSCVLLFAPRHLRDYVVCHELAHLTEMNHSPRFHALCDTYCGGREKELKAELDHYKWPIHFNV